MIDVRYGIGFTVPGRLVAPGPGRPAVTLVDDVGGAVVTVVDVVPGPVVWVVEDVAGAVVTVVDVVGAAVVVVVGVSLHTSLLHSPGPMFVPCAAVHAVGVSSWHCACVAVRMAPLTDSGRQQRIGVSPPQLPSALHASQQLACWLAHALPPLGALQRDALFFTVQRTRPFLSLRQHVTEPSSRPHVDFAEQTRRARTQFFGRLPACTRSVMISRVQCT